MSRWNLLLLAIAVLAVCQLSHARDPVACSVSTFEADITIPIGHACMGGGIANAKEIIDPLFAKGIVFVGADKPIVIVALDWCQCNNDSYDRWREVLAEAAGTTRQRVMLATVHQHDAPICDLRAQQLLDAFDMKGSICDAAFHEKAVQRVAAALKDSLRLLRPVTHVGTGQAKIEMLASNRRIARAGKPVNWDRTSADRTFDADPEGEVDPCVKTISLWSGDKPIVAINCYAIHPMSYYGRGGVNADFVGQARAMRQKDEPDVFQIYFTGCAGDTTAGKYNDGKPEQRAMLAKRLYDGMSSAWKATARTPIAQAEFRSAQLHLPARTGGIYEVDAMTRIIADPKIGRWERNCAALGLSWRERVDRKEPIDVPCLDLGSAQLLILPGESFVGYQLQAQKLRSDSFVMTAGFGDGAVGYLPTDACWQEGYADSYNWVAPAEASGKTAGTLMTEAITAALNK